MNTILKKDILNPVVTRMVIAAPLVARRAEPGQFIILRTHEDGERIPLTIADFDREAGTVTIIFQVVGATTQRLNVLNEGETICDFAGPLGRPTHTEGLKRVAVVGGGVGCAIAFPIAKKLHAQGCMVDAVIGFRNSEMVMLETEFAQNAARLYRMSDDGSWGTRGLVTDALEQLLSDGAVYDEVITIGPLPMMRAVCMLTKSYGVKTIASMNSVMIDGTGMCGGCRLTVGGSLRFACVDGPEFDGHAVDFDEAIARSTQYRDFERHAYEKTCNLLKGGSCDA